MRGGGGGGWEEVEAAVGDVGVDNSSMTKLSSLSMKVKSLRYMPR